VVYMPGMDARSTFKKRSAGNNSSSGTAAAQQRQKPLLKGLASILMRAPVHGSCRQMLS